MQAYLNDPNDPILSRRIAGNSNFPGGHGKVDPPSAGTSMLHSGPDSLAALTASTSTQTWRSTPTSRGERALGNPRILEHDAQGALQIAPLRHLAILECPFDFLHCRLSFESMREWIAHSLTHFQNKSPPQTNKCCFCERELCDVSGIKSWTDRMEHVGMHHQLGHRLAHARPDPSFHQFLWRMHLMSDADFKELGGQGSSRFGRNAHHQPSPSEHPAPYTTTNDRRERRH